MTASGQLFIAQSTLSRHIQSMEEELGVSLFDRNTRSISLSEFGAAFLLYAQKIVDLEAQYQYDLYNYKRKISGALSIGSIPSMSQYRITELFSRFHQQYPDYALDIVEGDSTELVEQLDVGKLDLSFIRVSADTEIDERFEQITYAMDQLAAIVPKAHRLAARQSLHINDLKGETLLLLASDTFMFQLCVAACQSCHFEPKVGFTGHRDDNILAMVAEGFGVALLTQNPVQDKLNERMVMIPIEPKIETAIKLIYRKDKKLGEQAKRFIALVQ